MFGRTFGTTEITTRMADMSGVADGATAVTSGLVAGTRVATRLGWRAVEAIAEGDEVLTFDDGLQRVIRIQRTRLTRCLRKHLPLRVPANALGNRTELWLMPEQAVVIENDVSETRVGDAFAAIPAAALEGFLGIERAVPAGEIEIITLFFENEQMVFTNAGAMLHCPAESDLVVDLFRNVERRSYNRVPAPVAANIARAVARDYGCTVADASANTAVA
jgi:hypothetical protein